jgi:G6PDH family F420-dependent oxidoreductase
MPKWGYKLMTEEIGPADLVQNALEAERRGFDFLAASDHYSPWVKEQGHSPFVWSVLGAVAAMTRKAELMTAVTCPLHRYHPAIVAQAAATVSLLSGGRFTLGLGAGERLNEHVVGGRWPPVGIRHRMMEEALDVLSELFEGGKEDQHYRGEYYELDGARLFDPPAALPVVLAAGGPQAAELAARRADGLMTTEADPKIVDAYRKAGGDGPLYAEVSLCYAADEKEAVATAHRYRRWSLLDWTVLAELPSVEAFAAASEKVRPEDVAEKIPCGPDLERHVEAVRPFLELGFDHIVLSQVGPDQSAFLEFFEDELSKALKSCARAIAA